MERLQRLEISKGYVELLAEAEELRYDFAGFLEELRTLKVRLQQGGSGENFI